ncbi:MAG: hypothetical protein ACM3XM_13675 [Mycobacterium leprae]
MTTNRRTPDHLRRDEHTIYEGMDRMQDEGGGVVEQVNPPGDPMLRNRPTLQPDPGVPPLPR